VQIVFARRENPSLSLFLLIFLPLGEPLTKEKDKELRERKRPAAQKLIRPPVPAVPAELW